MQSLDDIRKKLKDDIIRTLKPYIIKEIKLEYNRREKERKKQIQKDLYGMSYL